MRSSEIADRFKAVPAVLSRCACSERLARSRKLGYTVLVYFMDLIF
jgi:hypothetical protein